MLPLIAIFSFVKNAENLFYIERQSNHFLFFIKKKKENIKYCARMLIL